MQNAHERFGMLEFTKRMKDTTTRVRVHIDRAVLEPAKDERGQARAHLISMIGGDSEIGALWAAVAEAAVFQIYPPAHTGVTASLGPEAQCFRGSVALLGRKRPVRHLVAVSAELAKTKPGRTMRAHERFCAMTSRCLFSIALPIDMVYPCYRSGHPGLCGN